MEFRDIQPRQDLADLHLVIVVHIDGLDSPGHLSAHVYLVGRLQGTCSSHGDGEVASLSSLGLVIHPLGLLRPLPHKSDCRPHYGQER